MTAPAGGERLSAGEYCRAIETYLCRENGGHLVRIVGPAFQTVNAWHARGIPIAVVQQGIDRTLARDRAKAAARPARRPVRIEFCEADVLDAFDAWRRAVGVGMAGDREAAEAGEPEAPGGSVETDAAAKPGRSSPLLAHLDRAMRRLTQSALEPGLSAAAHAAIDAALAALDRLRPGARGARGHARAAIVAELAAIDEALGASVLAALPADLAGELSRAARAEVAPFVARMTAADAAAAEAAALRRLVRDRFRLPDLAL
jgi:hypothetical protein